MNSAAAPRNPATKSARVCCLRASTQNSTSARTIATAANATKRYANFSTRIQNPNKASATLKILDDLLMQSVHSVARRKDFHHQIGCALEKVSSAHASALGAAP